jgi:hypothetical protein
MVGPAVSALSWASGAGGGGAPMWPVLPRLPAVGGGNGGSGPAGVSGDGSGGHSEGGIQGSDDALTTHHTLVLLRLVRRAAAKPIWRSYLPQVPPA